MDELELLFFLEELDLEELLLLFFFDDDDETELILLYFLLGFSWKVHASILIDLVILCFLGVLTFLSTTFSS